MEHLSGSSAAKLLAVAWLSALPMALSLPAHAAGTIDLPALPGEDLPAALRRLHPCLHAPMVKVPEQIVKDNPERVGRDGGMVLVRPYVRLPKAFLDSRDDCAPRPVRRGPELRPHPEPEIREEHEAHPSDEHEASEEPGTAPRNHLSFAGLLDFSRLSATVYNPTTMPTWVSNPQPGFELGLARDLSPGWSIGLSYSFISTSLKDPGTVVFTEQTTALNELAASAVYRLSHRSRLALQLGAAQVDELGVNPLDGSLIIDHVFRGTVGFVFWQQLFHPGPFEILGALGAQTFIPFNWSVDSVGVGELFRLLIEREFTRHLSAELGALGAYERQQTQNESHSELSVTFALGLGYHF